MEGVHLGAGEMSDENTGVTSKTVFVNRPIRAVYADVSGGNRARGKRIMELLADSHPLVENTTRCVWQMEGSQDGSAYKQKAFGWGY